MRLFQSTLRQALLLALLETAWLVAVATVVGAMIGDNDSPPTPLLIALASFANLFFNLLPGAASGRVAGAAGRLGAAVLAILALGLFPPRVPFVLLALLLVWHARSLAEDDLPEARYRAAVVAGTLGVTVALLARTVLPAMPPAARTEQNWAALVFAAVALVSLVYAQRLQLMEEDELADSGRKIWGAALAAVAGGAAATALLVALVPSLARAGLAGLHLAASLVGTALYYLLLPVGYLLFAILYGPLLALLRRAHAVQPPQQPRGANPLEQLRQQQEAMNHTLDGWLTIAMWVAIALAALAVLLLVSGAVRRRAETSQRASDQRESVWRWSYLGDWLAQLLRRRSTGQTLSLPGRSGKRNANATPRSAREMYVSLQVRAARLGSGRLPRQTALEHCGDLAGRLPGVAPALRRLAVGYGDERYGAVAPAVVVPTLLDDWRQIVEACDVMEHHGT